MTYLELQAEIKNIVVQQDPMYVNLMLPTRINNAVSTIAAGIRMPDRSISPPLPDLYSSAVVETTVNAYADLPATYQRHLFYVVDPNSNKIEPPRGGDYYSFLLFLKQILKKDLSQTGSVSNVVAKGSKLYYQGIPSATADLTVHFYRKPVDMSADDSTPDGIPDHLQRRLINNYVAKEIYGEVAKKDKLIKEQMIFHETEFYSAMMDLIDFIGVDTEPVYYGSSETFVDLGVCD